MFSLFIRHPRISRSHYDNQSETARETSQFSPQRKQIPRWDKLVEANFEFREGLKLSGAVVYWSKAEKRHHRGEHC